ncbi:ion transporter, partial [Patescibacteria group bacterium]|nr:ion transporter [Patescibacteria group bacterium]
WMREAFANEQSTLYRVVNDIIVLLIFFSIGSIVMASVEDFYLLHQSFFDISEMVVVGIFTVEYLANIYVAEDKLKYILGPWGVIDILAIVPSYLNIIDLRAIKVFRVLRVLRFLRLMRMLRLLKLAKHVTKGHEHEHKANKFDTLKMDLQIYFIAMFSVVVIFSTLMYYAEKAVEGSPFTTIPNAMWWCIVTITTVGYGDMYPTSILGRLIAAVTMFCGLALFGLLMNVIGKYMMTSLFGAEDLNEIDIKEIEESAKKK